MEEANKVPHDDIRSFGRRHGRKLSARQQGLLANVLPRLRIDLEQPPPENATSLFATDAKDVWLEIGFGGGEHLIWQAEHHPNVGLIGCEPYLDGVVKVLDAVETKGLKNIRVLPDDARRLLRWLPDQSISRVFILFPDPWPKKRHWKRRLVSTQFLATLARVLKPGAELRLATDIGDYARTSLLAFRASPGYAWLAAGPSDWRERTPDWPPTRYEQKAIAQGRRPVYLRFRWLGSAQFEQKAPK
ncbi:MAG: tRNA (guanosine(46)-N7)-methyltransferase TrmB [Proteobacteria bacterium]|jgi:tRNA (guanine-N7-)-methyltransferase|nr:MAG: tRNA (guanosine(46)-N7)-methyltransferase TrmB [Pseudomonadota bacterium]